MELDLEAQAWIWGSLLRFRAQGLDLEAGAGFGKPWAANPMLFAVALSHAGFEAWSGVLG